MRGNKMKTDNEFLRALTKAERESPHVKALQRLEAAALETLHDLIADVVDDVDVKEITALAMEGRLDFPAPYRDRLRPVVGAVLGTIDAIDTQLSWLAAASSARKEMRRQKQAGREGRVAAA
jgi:hypothetical protein